MRGFNYKSPHINLKFKKTLIEKVNSAVKSCKIPPAYD